MSDDLRREALLRAFGNRLRLRRSAAGLTQEVLAHLAELDRSYVGGVERGERNVSLVNLVALAQACGVTVAELLANIERDTDELEGLQRQSR